jgi:hypothetical protein
LAYVFLSLVHSVSHQPVGISLCPNTDIKSTLSKVLLLLTTKKSSNSVSNTLAHVSQALGSTLGASNNGISGAVHSTGARGILVHVTTIVIFALSLSSVDAFLGSQVADRLEETALANLARG